jgi:putative transposase
MVEQDNNKLSVRRQCELLGIHRSGLYYRPRKTSALNLHLMQIIDRQYTATPFYGVPRMTEFIRQLYGYCINEKRVERLYKVMDIRAIGPNPYTSRPGKSSHKFPYLLRGLEITKPNQVWCADITFIALRRGFLYLFSIIDLFSRFIVNWGVSNTMTAQWCVDVTREAITQHTKPQIFNTDQGSQFTSDLFVNLLTGEEIQISMDGKGRAIDNVFIERFWRSFKYEYVYLNPPNGGMELYQGTDEYMRFYNYERIHESLEYRTPADLYFGKKVAFIPTKYSTQLV